VESLGLLIRERGLGVDFDPRDVDDILEGVAQRLLALCEDPFGRLVGLSVVLLHCQLDHYRGRPEQLTGDFEILLVCVRGPRAVVLFEEREQ